ncbi:ketodeoxygluconokinase [Vibrio albus]|uniref:2-dehydro-3-deoxygluconokinase n=1 Tax=Vibrio albus TaxID=2200953 RepID=A0A2U3B6N4_9VIBR|nr:sugar kinase [Vibrio albus]PWI32432.1 ketodeoxygluconokinase [Vibrio albus]
MSVNNVAIIGECMVELRKTESGVEQGFGGDTLNTAIYLSRLTLGSGVHVCYVTGLGKDPFSKGMLKNWQDEQINTDMVYLSDDKLPGMYAIETADDGERSFYYWRNDAAAKFWLKDFSPEALAKELAQHQLIYLSGISLAILPADSRQTLIDALTLCHNDGISIAFDNNFRPALWESKDEAQHWYKQTLSITDTAFLTFDDEQALWGDISEQDAITRTQALGVKEIVIKRGSDTCLIIHDNTTTEVAPARIDNVVDTTAAGDSFSAGYLAKRILGGSCEESGASGHKVAGTVIQHRGAIIPKDAMPNI